MPRGEFVELCNYGREKPEANNHSRMTFWWVLGSYIFFFWGGGGVAVMSIHRKNCCEWACCCSEFRLQPCFVYENTRCHGLCSRTCEIRLSGDKIWQRPVVEAQVW